MNHSASTLPFRLLAITPGRRAGWRAALQQVVDAGGSDVALLLREPGISPAELQGWAEEVLPRCRAAGAWLLVHGDAEVARVAGADGVHFPDHGFAFEPMREMLGPAAIIGVSRHSVDGLRQTAGATYATLSPIFPTPGKGAPLGRCGLARACAASATPVVALGGIMPERAAECREVGAAAVAAVRGIWSGNVQGNVMRLLAAFRQDR